MGQNIFPTKIHELHKKKNIGTLLVTPRVSKKQSVYF
ncbi:unnamed protein product [Ixodes persulcatus]